MLCRDLAEACLEAACEVAADLRTRFVCAANERAIPPTALSRIKTDAQRDLFFGLMRVRYPARATGGAEEPMNQKMFETALYRVLFVVMSPARLLTATSHRWSAFRRGSTLSTVYTERHRAQLQLAFPAELEPPCMLHGFSGAFRAATRAAGGHVISMKWTQRSPTLVHWDILWR